MKKIFIRSGAVLCSMLVTQLDAVASNEAMFNNFLLSSSGGRKCNHKDLTPTIKALERDNAELKDNVRILTREKNNAYRESEKLQNQIRELKALLDERGKRIEFLEKRESSLTQQLSFEGGSSMRSEDFSQAISRTSKKTLQEEQTISKALENIHIKTEKEPHLYKNIQTKTYPSKITEPFKKEPVAKKEDFGQKSFFFGK